MAVAVRGGRDAIAGIILHTDQGLRTFEPGGLLQPRPSRGPRAAGGRAGHPRRRHRRHRRRLRRPGAAGAPARPARDPRAGLPRQPAVDQEGAGRPDRHHRHGSGVHRCERAAARADPEPGRASAQRRGRRGPGVEVRARREVWRRRETELCRPGIEAASGPDRNIPTCRSSMRGWDSIAASLSRSRA